MSSPAEIYAAARAAGLSPARAVTATAVALAESGGNPAAVGDVNLQTPVWGPSVGWWQVRTLKAATGSGGPRDITALQASPAAQAAAMATISRGGANFTPWTTYTSGAYMRYLPTASAAAAQATGNPTIGVATPTGAPSGVAAATPASTGPWPWQWGSDVAAGFRGIGIVLVKLAFTGLGAALIIAGAASHVADAVPGVDLVEKLNKNPGAGGAGEAEEAGEVAAV